MLGLSSSSDTSGISDWALDALLRRRAYENAQGAGDTLASIVSLVNQIEGMPVDKDVTEDVKGSLDALDNVRTLDSACHLIASTSLFLTKTDVFYPTTISYPPSPPICRSTHACLTCLLQPRYARLTLFPS